jgi:hypothetical protein
VLIQLLGNELRHTVGSENDIPINGRHYLGNASQSIKSIVQCNEV